MGHCISVFLINKSELRSDKINSILDYKKYHEDLKWVDLGSGILATTHIPNVRLYGKDKTIAKISTDYFGGFGYQEAKLFVNNKKEYEESTEFGWPAKPINRVLEIMGVIKKEGMDEFDTIGLGRYRSNEDFKL